MTAQSPALREHGNAYNIFILVLTLFSLALMVLQVLPLDAETLNLLRVYDNTVCVVFLLDFGYNLASSRPKSAYFIRQRGWLDLLGSMPTLGVFQLSALLRLARLSRLARIGRLLSGKHRRELVRDVVRNRGQYATFITILAAGLVLTTASIIVLQVERQSPDSNIQDGGDALWWGLVTITTVGYGDRFPVTLVGRTTGMLVMLAGVGIIGALASILASLLVPPAREVDEEPGGAPGAAGGPVTAGGPASAVQGEAVPDAEAILAEIGRLRDEIAALRASIEPGSG